MKIEKTLYVTERKALRNWFAKNHNKEKVIWLVYYRKSSGKPRISYNDAVEEALCHGWIDSTIKKIDDKCFAQRFTPRRPNSSISQMNIERIHQLIAKKRMKKAGLDAIAKLYDKESKNRKLRISQDISNALKKDKQVWKNFNRFPKYYKRIRIAYIESYGGRGKEEFKKRLQNFIKNTAKNKRIGFVKEMK
jgi:uncharacterized protein YdeI (YjbR/CyaY-like superfamily)